MLCHFPSLSLDAESRVNPYRLVHKAIRAMLGRLVEAAGRTDFVDQSAFDRLRSDTLDAVHMLQTHARMEVHFLDSLLGAYAPAKANDVQREHAELDAELLGVLGELDLAVAEPTGAAIRARGHAFYLRLSRFVAHYFVHMADEELCVLPLLHRYVDEIVLRRAIVAAQASLPHEERARTYLLVLDAITRQERDMLFATTKRLDPRAVVRSPALERRAVR